MKILVVLGVLCSFWSYGQMNTDRPAYSISAQTIRKGEFQIEAGIQLNNAENGHPTVSFLQAPTAQFRIGLSDLIELRVQNGVNFRRGLTKSRLRASIDNFEMGLKFNLLHKQKSNMSMVFQGILPTASGELHYLEAGGRFILAVDHRIKESGRIGYNFGSKLSSVDQADPNFQAYYTVFYEHKMNSNLSIFAEAYNAFSDIEEFDIDNMELNLDFGLTYGISNNLQLDYSFGFGLLQQMNFHSVGVSYRIQPELKRRLH